MPLLKLNMYIEVNKNKKIANILKDQINCLYEILPLLLISTEFFFERKRVISIKNHAKIKAKITIIKIIDTL